jgi:hypothetical protein
MPWESVKLIPGLNVELTDTLNRTGYTATNLGRFRNGLFQKIGGWASYVVNAVSGVPVASHAWQDLSGNDHLAIGTTTALEDILGSTINNIAPQTLTSSPAVNFSTVSGSPTVTIVDTNLAVGVTPNDAVFFNVPISVGGLILSGLYQVTANVSATSYTITAASNATATVNNGGSVPTFTTTSGSSSVSIGFTAHGLILGDDIVFQIPTTIGGITISGRYVAKTISSANAFLITGSNAASSSAGPTSMNSGNAQFVYYLATGPQAGGSGYGTGNYSAGTYGFGSAIAGETGAYITATDWTLDNWGEILLSCPDGGAIYYWDPGSGFLNSPVVATGPVFNTGIFVSIAEQIAVAFGSTVEAVIGVYQDPLFVRWSDVSNFFNWTATVTNQAGSYHVARGSKIVGGIATPHRNLLWTDLDLWELNYIGSSLVFNENEVGANCGLIAKHAFAQLADIVYWMGSAGFFQLTGGGVSPIPCAVWDAVYQDLDTANQNKCFAGANSLFSEVFFFFPSLSGRLGYCDKYAKYNTLEGIWDIGTLQRNTWIDKSVINYPIATTQTGVVYKHEFGKDDGSNAIMSSFDTGWFYVGEGEDIVFLDKIFPDFRWGFYGGSQNAQIRITIYAVMYPGDTPASYGPFTITQATQFIDQRLRARQIKLHVESDDVGSFWRLGQIRVRWAPDGKV